jgi:hypothetical protein
MQMTVRGRLFPTPDQVRTLDELIRHQSACTRYAYNRLCEGWPKPRIEAIMQQKFPSLNSRYRRGAYQLAATNFAAG